MKHSFDLTLEVRSTDGTAAEFYQSDAQRVAKALRFLATPRLFAEPQLTLASEHCVTTIATRAIDVILARTNAPAPEVLPMKSPAGAIDISEVAHLVRGGDESLVIADQRNRVDPPNSRSSAWKFIRSEVGRASWTCARKFAARLWIAAIPSHTFSRSR